MHLSLAYTGVYPLAYHRDFGECMIIVWNRCHCVKRGKFRTFDEVKCNLTKLTNNECAVSCFSGQRFPALARLGFLCSWALQQLVSGLCIIAVLQ